MSQLSPSLCFVSPTFLPKTGGTEILVFEVARRLAAWGHRVTLLTRGGRNLPRVASQEGIRVVRGRFPERRWAILPYQAWLLGSLVRGRGDYDLVHQFHVFHAGGAVAVARRLTRKPLVTTLIGWDTHDELRPLPRMTHPYLGWVMNASDAVVAISGALVPHARAQGCRRPIEVQHLGADLERFHPGVEGRRVREELGLEAQDVMVLAVQRLDYRKRLEVLLRAVALCSAGAPRLKLVIAGRGPERRRLETLAAQLGLADRVRFAGFVPDGELPSYYAACDLFALHSTYEGFGIVLAEAMAAGKPVVATRVGAVPEVVEEGRTGRLVPPDDAEALAAALGELSADRQLRARMGRAARRVAEERFDWDAVTRRYLDTYLAVLSRRAGGG